MGFGWVTMVLFWGLIVFGIFYLVRYTLGTAAEKTAKLSPALDILKKRYAAGEISLDEYEKKKHELINS